MTSRTFLFMPESAYGPTNNCIGIGHRLRERGHRVVFAAEASWAGKLEVLGFEEDLVDLAPPPEDGGVEQDAGQFWTDFIRDTSPEFRKPTIEQLSTFVQPTWQALIDGAMYCQPHLQDIIERQRPDVLIEDNVNCFPALLTADRPFVRMMSCNPLEVRGPDVPPVFSGYPLADRTGWDEFRAEYDRTHRPMWTEYDEWVRSCGAPGLPDLDFIHTSQHLNLYLYPEVVDYVHERPLDATWHRLDSSVRATDAAFTVPEPLRDGPGSLIYLSLGSLGSADVGLMQRLVDVLGRTPHRYIVSKGPQHEQYELADNMWGAHQVPQTNVLPLVDLVITHGGNNTTTECFHFGKPMIVLPLFWDQYDNAQRVHETGYGVRLDTYRFTDEQLSGAIQQLLADTDLRSRMAANATAIQQRSGTTRAADLIEQVATRACSPGWTTFTSTLNDGSEMRMGVHPTMAIESRTAAVTATAGSPLAAGGGRIELTSLSKWYGDQQVLKAIDLTIEAGEFFSLLGPSGCGKTTTLRLIGGFEQIEEGSVTIDGVDMRDVAPEKRPVNTVFQSYALFPHQNVEQNVAFGLRFQHCTKAERKRRVGEALELVRLNGFESRRPHQMSGGQQQRVALARSLVLRPKVLLLDEPLGALDAKLRRVLQVELRALHQEVGITFVYVTHDQEEALTMSDRLAVMRGGEIDQIGTPRQVYDEPATTYVADFLGIANLVPAHVVRDGELELAGVRVRADTAALDGACQVLVRPERVRLVPVGEGVLRADVEHLVFAGPITHVHLRVGQHALQAVVPNDGTPLVATEGGQVDLTLAPDALRVLAN